MPQHRAQKSLSFEVFSGVIVNIVVSIVMTPFRVLGRASMFRRNVLDEECSSETSVSVHESIRPHSPKRKFFPGGSFNEKSVTYFMLSCKTSLCKLHFFVGIHAGHLARRGILGRPFVPTKRVGTRESTTNPE